jgi:hypothetical protein
MQTVPEPASLPSTSKETMNFEEKLKQLDNLFNSLPAKAKNELDQLVNKRDASKPPYNK